MDPKTAPSPQRRVPLVVGGSGLYVRGLLDRLEIPPTDPRVRAAWEDFARERGAQAAYRRLSELDPVAAAGILPGNVRRVVRALEVIELTGRPFSATLPERRYVAPTLTFGLRLDRTILDERIALRTKAMWDAGLLSEVAELLGQGLREGRTARTAIGYQQAIAQHDGELTQDQAIEATTTATRRYVRRQESWLRPDPRIVWLDAADPDRAARALDQVSAFWPGGRQ